MKEARPTPKERRVIAGQKTYLMSKSPLRCYYYAKQDRARWSTADRSVQGMRWNYYMLKGRTPLFSHIEHDNFPPAAQKLKEMREGKEARSKDEKENHARCDSKDEHSEKKGIGAVPNLREIETGHVSSHPGEDVVPVSSHGDFRPLRIVPPEERAGIPIARVIPFKARGGHAVPVSGNVSGPPQAQSAVLAQTALPQASVQTAVQAWQEEPTAHHALTLAVPGTKASFKAYFPHSETGAQGQAVPAIEPGQPVHQPAHMTQSLSFTLIVPHNDNARPGGHDEPLREGGPCGTVRVFSPVIPIRAEKGIGYISSPRKKVAQLKLASGAASMPQ